MSGGNFEVFRAGGNIPHRLYDPGNHLASARLAFTGKIFRQFAGVMRVSAFCLTVRQLLFRTGRGLFSGDGLLFSTED